MFDPRSLPPCRLSSPPWNRDSIPDCCSQEPRLLSPPRSSLEGFLPRRSRTLTLLILSPATCCRISVQGKCSWGIRASFLCRAPLTGQRLYPECTWDPGAKLHFPWLMWWCSRRQDERLSSRSSLALSATELQLLPQGRHSERGLPLSSYQLQTLGSDFALRAPGRISPENK